MGVPILYSVCCALWVWFLVANWGDIGVELRMFCVLLCSAFFVLAVLSVIGLIVTSG